MIVQEIEFAVEKENGIVTRIGRSTVCQPRTDMGKDKGSVKWYQDMPTGGKCSRGQKG